MSTDLGSRLEGLVSTSEAGDYAATGFHHKHTADLKNLVAIAEASAKAGYFLEMMTCEDRREDAQAMRLCYTFNALEAVDRHLLKVDVPPVGAPNPSFTAPTLNGVYRGANWFEREVFDMYGVDFEGHPELERILLPEDADFFALRRDFGRIEDAESEDDAEASDD